MCELDEIAALYVYVDDSGLGVLVPLERWESSDLADLESLINAELQSRSRVDDFDYEAGFSRYEDAGDDDE